VPERAAAPATAIDGSASRRAGGPQRVLYVDDEPALTAFVRELLGLDGIEVTTCDSAEEALRRLRTDAFDALISDCNMPGLSGIGLARELARTRPGLPVILSSGFFTPELQREAAALGVRALVNKAELVEELPRLLHDILAAHCATASV
jgi:CheY-like chemotaxis protein